MNIIVRASGERTEDECIRLAKRHGSVDVIRAFPFGESIRQTYDLASTYKQKWTPVIDADVLLEDGVLKQSIHELKTMNQNIFCLDGKTNDKILMTNRRAGIHIYNTEMLEYAKKYIQNDHIKPESNVRRLMESEGFPTHSSKIIFGIHDYHQYYKDLWRKAVCQTKKLAKMIKKTPGKWRKFSKFDKDFLVIYNAHVYGNRIKDKIIIDSRIDYNAEENIRKLGLKEKGKFKG